MYRRVNTLRKERERRKQLFPALKANSKTFKYNGTKSHTKNLKNSIYLSVRIRAINYLRIGKVSRKKKLQFKKKKRKKLSTCHYNIQFRGNTCMYCYLPMHHVFFSSFFFYFFIYFYFNSLPLQWVLPFFRTYILHL